MKVLFVNKTKTSGGAAVAMNRLKVALEHKGVEVEVLDDWYNPRQKAGRRGNCFQIRWLRRLFLTMISDFVKRLAYPKKYGAVSFAMVNGGLIEELNRLNADIVHLHWVGAGTLSVSDINNISAKVVWTQHDPWLVNGALHYEGVKKYDVELERPGFPSLRLKLMGWSDYLIKLRKRKLKPVLLVAPSEWMYGLLHQSENCRQHQVERLPNVIDTNFWSPVEKKAARTALNLDQQAKVVLFGANSATSDPRKGWHILKRVLEAYDFSRDTILVVFGGDQPIVLNGFSGRVLSVGQVSSRKELVELYCCADVLVLPSIEDNLPNIALEAMSCNLPVVTFDVGGMSDIVDHKVNGYLVEPFDSTKFHSGIRWALSLSPGLQGPRQAIIKKFDSATAVSGYLDLYSRMLNGQYH